MSWYCRRNHQNQKLVWSETGYDTMESHRIPCFDVSYPVNSTHNPILWPKVWQVSPLAGGELGTSYFLPRIVGRGRAAAHLLTGKEISTEQAEQWGLLNEAWSNGDLGVSEHGVYHQLATLRGKMLMNQWDWRVLQDVGKSRQKYRGGTCLIGWIAILMLNLLPFKWGNAIPS
jgi:hypothetical protein